VSYLNPVRIHFAGQFRADVSTVNNQARRFDNADFVIPRDQLPGSGTQGGMWQPAGTGAWKIDRCAVTGAVLGGKAVRDPVVGLQIRDSGDRVSAKLVDLDPNQQMVSTIFGLEIRIVDPVSKHVLMRGDFEPAAFYDIWNRAIGSSGDMAYSAFYQSVLTGVEWGDLEGSAVLQALKAASEPDLLSILFNVDSFALSGDERGYGRMVGTIGPQLADDPAHFVPGRYLAPLQSQSFGNQPAPIAQLSSPLGYVCCWLDRDNRKLVADFGNAIPTGGCGLADVGPLHLLCLQSSGPGGRAETVLDLGALQNYAGPGWYERTAGIQAFPPFRPLTEAEMTAVAGQQLCVATPTPGEGFFVPIAMEAPDGIFVRPDLFVFRMEPNSSQTVRVMALQHGEPLPDLEIATDIGLYGLQPSGRPLATPASGLAASNGTTDSTGWASIALASGDPGLPRIPDGNPANGVDGQVYAIGFSASAAANAGTAFDQNGFVSVLVYSKVEVPEQPSWSDAQPIFQQYSNLYPRAHGPDRYVPYAGRPPLHPVVNLSNEVEVAGFAAMIQRALQRPITDPNHMPVTRDLSQGRRQILLNWVGQVLGSASAATGAGPALPKGPAQNPSRDFAGARAAFVESAGAAPASEGAEPPDEPLGGKTAAMLRMKGVSLTGSEPEQEDK
jgi:hypothetical protein